MIHLGYIVAGAEGILNGLLPTFVDGTENPAAIGSTTLVVTDAQGNYVSEGVGTPTLTPVTEVNEVPIAGVYFVTVPVTDLDAGTYNVMIIAGSYDDPPISLVGQVIATFSVVADANTPIVVINPVLDSGELVINCGDDYTAENPILFGVPEGFMSLSGATLTLDIMQIGGQKPKLPPALTLLGTVVIGSYTIDGQVFTTALQFTATAAQTSLLKNWQPQGYQYRVRAIWTPAPTVTIVRPNNCTVNW